MSSEKFADIVNDRHDYAKRWKARTGGKVLGYFCCFMPEELLYAADILPVRILGDNEPAVLSSGYLLGFSCSFSRSCLHQVLKGDYSYLDGVVMPYSCTHIFAAFDSWRRYIPLSYHYMLYVPKLMDEKCAHDDFISELKEFKISLEQLAGRAINDQALGNAIELINTNRKLMMQVYELRKTTPPLLSGAEAMEMVLSSMIMDKREHNALLVQWLKELANRADKPKAGVRLMVIGSELNDAGVLRLVEQLGANIVTDDMCMGTRYFWGEVSKESDPLRALAKRYLGKVSCPTKISTQRYPRIYENAVAYGVQGVMLVKQKFCNPHASTLPLIEKFFKNRGIPSFWLELDGSVPEAQCRSRAEPFIEMLTTELV